MGQPWQRSGRDSNPRDPNLGVVATPIRESSTGMKQIPRLEKET